jgi:hypothetical protein
MKAVILEIIKGRAVVMKADGSVTKIRNKNYSVGEEIYMKEGIFSHRRWAPLVAALLIFAMIGTGTWAYATPAYEISLVGEEEMLFEVNKLGKVIKVRYDERDDFEELKPDGDFNGKDINEAIILVLDELSYEDDEYENLVITAIAKNKEESDRIAKSLQEKMEEYWAEEELEDSEEFNEEDKAPKFEGLSEEDIAILEDYQITPGKLNIVRNLMGLDDSETDFVEDYLDGLEDGLEEDEDLSKKIMEEFSARNGEKNNPSVNAPGQEDKEEREEKDNPSQFAPGQLKKQGIEVNENEDNDDDNDEDDMEDNDDSGRPESPGKSNEAPGQNKDKNKNNG